MEINKKEWKEFHEEMERLRGFNEEEWRLLNPGLKTLISLKTHISGKGNGLFKEIIRTLTNHEKRLRVVETDLHKGMKDLKSRVKTLEQNNSYYPTKEEIRDIKVGGTD